VCPWKFWGPVSTRPRTSCYPRPRTAKSVLGDSHHWSEDLFSRWHKLDEQLISSHCLLEIQHHYHTIKLNEASVVHFASDLVTVVSSQLHALSSSSRSDGLQSLTSGYWQRNYVSDFYSENIRHREKVTQTRCCYQSSVTLQYRQSVHHLTSCAAHCLVPTPEHRTRDTDWRQPCVKLRCWIQHTYHAQTAA